MILFDHTGIVAVVAFPRIGGGDPPLESALERTLGTFPRIGGGDPMVSVEICSSSPLFPA